MLSAIIPTSESERVLVPTLAALIPGASDGILREVIFADAGSTDATAEIADAAGCRVLTAPGALGPRLKAAAAKAKGPWLMFLRPGTVLDAAWIADARRYIEAAEQRDLSQKGGAVFRLGSAADRPMIVEALLLLRAALGGRPRPEQGLIVAKRTYTDLGGHRDRAETEADFLRRLGRRRIEVLRAGAAPARN